MDTPLRAARAYLAAGLSPLPVRPDGSKAPSLPEGHPVLLRQRRVTEDEAGKHWRAGRRGVALQCGAASGHLVCLDFERPGLLPAWLDDPTVSPHAARLCVVRTPRPGWHVWYRCAGPVGGGTRLAASAAGDLWIEWRGEGQYALAPGSPAACHASGRLYEHAEGPPLTALAVFSAAAHTGLLAAAAALGEAPPSPAPAPAPAPVPAPATDRSADEQVGDVFNREGPDWPTILEPHGWRCVRTEGAVRHWRRPGKEQGSSATTGAVQSGDGCDLFYVFSTNARPFAKGGYSKFRAYGILNHGGDLSRAAGDLAAQGYAPAAPAPPPAAGGTPPAAAPVPHPRKAAARAAGEAAGPDAGTDAETLLMTEMPPIRWAVPNLISEGLTVLAGRPKAGKSWFALHVAMCIAAGRPVLNSIPVERGPVLYLALEDTVRRLQKRLQTLAGERLTAAELAGLHFHLRWPALENGSLERLQRRVDEIKPRLLIIDTLAKVRPAASRRADASAYDADYSFMSQLKRLADERQAAVACLHHTSKTPRADPVDEVSGTLGIAGCADTILVLKRDRQGQDLTLFMTGRDVDEQELGLHADLGRGVWQLQGTAAAQRISREREEVLAQLRRRPEGLTRDELADALGKSPVGVRKLLWRMCEEGLLERAGRQYRVP
ncbi:MAG: AAA family ATPase [Gemmataceae bacterium]